MNKKMERMGNEGKERKGREKLETKVVLRSTVRQRGGRKGRTKGREGVTVLPV